MRIKTIFTLLFMLLLTVACSNQDSTVSTDPTPKDAYMMPSWEITLEDNSTIVVNLADMLSRSAQFDPEPPGWMPDGTDMTADELRMYFSVNISESKNPFVCAIFQILYPVLQGESDFMMTFMVLIMELNMYDVPNKAEAEAEGSLTPPC